MGTSSDYRPTMTEQDVGWITANRRPFSDFAVGSLVPVVFEGYARVLHSAWARPGGLPTTQLTSLCELLATHTNAPELCFVGVWEGYGWLTADAEWAAAPTLRLDQRTFLVRQGPLGLALAVGRGGPTGGTGIEPPSIFWPADRAWLVASDPDLDSTYLGGSNALIEAVLTHPDLETWRATAADLVATGSDEINAR